MASSPATSDRRVRDRDPYDDEGWAPALVTNALGHRTRVRCERYASGQPERIGSPGGVVSRTTSTPSAGSSRRGRTTRPAWSRTCRGRTTSTSSRAGAGMHIPAMVEQRHASIAPSRRPGTRARGLSWTASGASCSAGRAARRLDRARPWLRCRGSDGPGLAPRPGRRGGLRGTDARAGPALRRRRARLVAETVSLYGSVERVTREPRVVVEHDREDTDPASPHHDTPCCVESDAAGRMTCVVDRIVYALRRRTPRRSRSVRHDALGRLVERRDPAAWSRPRRGRPTGASSGASTGRWGRGRSTTPLGSHLRARRARLGDWLRYDALDRVIPEVHGGVPSASPAVTYTDDHAPSNGVGLLAARRRQRRRTA